MRLSYGAKVEVSRIGTLENGYFQGFSIGSTLLDGISITETKAIVLYENGTLNTVPLEFLKVAKDEKDNILREFVAYAAENKVAPTELVNIALKEL